LDLFDYISQNESKIFVKDKFYDEILYNLDKFLQKLTEEDKQLIFQPIRKCYLKYQGSIKANGTSGFELNKGLLRSILIGVNSSSPTFTANFSMAKLDGSAKHTHNISDFKIAGTPATDNSGTTYSGTATVSLKAGPANNVPVTILISNNGDFSLNVDPKATESHFGNTPIMGKVNTA
jgi:hypothetical protein